MMKEVTMSKQTAVEWLFAHLVPHLDWSKVEDRKLFRKLKAEAEQMHKEEIVNAWNDGDYAYFYSKETGRDFVDGSEYYNETFGGNNE